MSKWSNDELAYLAGVIDTTGEVQAQALVIESWFAGQAKSLYGVGYDMPGGRKWLLYYRRDEVRELLEDVIDHLQSTVVAQKLSDALDGKLEAEDTYEPGESQPDPVWCERCYRPDYEGHADHCDAGSGSTSDEKPAESPIQQYVRNPERVRGRDLAKTNQGRQ